MSGLYDIGVSFFQLPAEEQIADLTAFAPHILESYGLRDCVVESINYEYNATFRITTPTGEKYALRININSPRTPENTRAEIFWVQRLLELNIVNLARPIPNQSGEFLTRINHAPSGRTLTALLYSWLEGEELGDEPSLEQVKAIGAAMAAMHAASENFLLPAGASLPTFDDPMWGVEDLLLGAKSVLDPQSKTVIAAAFALINKRIEALYRESAPQIIHADLHGWNMMWHEGELAIFDFDDCGFGLPIQDLATAIYYLDTPEQDQAMLDGYLTVRPLPQYTEFEMKSLLLHRRFMLLNYLYETENQEHQEMIPDYQLETVRRAKVYLAEASQADIS
ncbi:MAG: phosphotransferase [Actinobacteria bacterium]|uniref:Unannotated protein n=1 Tax=freshwater metagenome TaxID=449393 RepID=A0A6J6HQB4_9ZZZZ|nr:phosphotransferase [Actinomycetota bacterium]MTA04105.1 phosphotransferase [Actinomycetota bacterium]